MIDTMVDVTRLLIALTLLQKDPEKDHSSLGLELLIMAFPNYPFTITTLVFLVEVFATLLVVGLSANLFVILLEGGKILTSLREFTFLHTLTDVPVDESTLHVHEVELVVDAGEGFGNGGRVGNHAHGTLDTGNVSARDKGRSLVVDSALETGGAPVNELDGTLGLDGGNGSVDILGDNISTVHEAASHVLSVARIALGHHVGWLKHRVGDLSHGELLVVGLGLGDDRSVGGEHKVDAGVRHQVGLELGDIDVEGSIETQGSGQRGDNLSDETVQVGVSRALNAEVTAAHIVESLVVEAEGTVGVLKESVGGEHGVVRLNNGSRHLRGRRDGEGKLRLASVVDREPLKEKRSETGSGSSSGGMEDEETLKTSAVISKLADAVEDKVNNLLSGGVVSTGVVVGSVFLSVDDLLGVVELTVGSVADFVTHGRLQIDVNGTGNVLSGSSLAEECVESIISNTNRGVGSHLSIGSNAVLNAVELPALVSNLNTGLAQMNRDTF